jgi:hypothetical protein
MVLFKNSPKNRAPPIIYQSNYLMGRQIMGFALFCHYFSSVFFFGVYQLFTQKREALVLWPQKSHLISLLPPPLIDRLSAKFGKRKIGKNKSQNFQLYFNKR